MAPFRLVLPRYISLHVYHRHSRTSMSIREDADYESSLESHTSTSALPKPLQNKLQNKDLSLSMPSAKTLGERFHPYNRFSRRPAFAQQGNGTINQAPQSKPVKATDSGQRGAERFLSNMEQSLGLSKQEPIEPAIPPVCEWSWLEILFTYFVARYHNTLSACSFVDAKEE